MRIRGLGRRDWRRPERLISQYGVGQRLVELVRLSDGCVRWICSCDRYRSSVDAAHGPWCKHIAKAAAMRSIERLTGERVISRASVYGGRSEAPLPQPALAPDAAILSRAQHSGA